MSARARGEEERTVQVEIYRESDQGCEPATSGDEGVMTMENEDWLIDFSEEVSTPTLSHLVPLLSLFLNSTNDCMNNEFLITFDLHGLCYSYDFSVMSCFTTKLSQSSSPATAGSL